jgi:hypothetical protein
MSVVVELSDLPAALDAVRSAYLLSVGPQHRVKVVSVAPTLVDGVLVLSDPGPGSLRNASAHPDVTVLLVHRDDDGPSLLVDGRARVEGLDVLVEPSGAVWHRPAPTR